VDLRAAAELTLRADPEALPVGATAADLRIAYYVAEYCRPPQFGTGCEEFRPARLVVRPSAELVSGSGSSVAMRLALRDSLSGVHVLLAQQSARRSRAR
jgi:hypothetical protein